MREVIISNIHVEPNYIFYIIYVNNLQICNEFARQMADDCILNSGINRLLQLLPLSSLTSYGTPSPYLHNILSLQFNYN